jgi:COP9 signalosome complex subunit 2
MSDDEFMMSGDEEIDMDDYMEGSGDEGSEHESEEEQEEEEDKKSDKPKKITAVMIENQYYRSKDKAEEEGPPYEKALEGFQKVLDMEKTKDGRNGDWSFKALKKIVGLTFKLGDEEKLLQRFSELLKYNSSENNITENDLFKGITKILDSVSGAASIQTDIVLKMYDLALAAMKAANNENLWFKTNLKLAQKMFDKGLYKKLEKILADLKESCMLGDGSENPRKGGQLLDIYALEIQMHMERKDRKKTKDIFEKGFATAKKNPGTLNSKLAIFHFVGGKLHMEQHNWKEAYSAFFEAFNYFEEAGSKFKIPCLKYIVLSNMLMHSEINPFSSAETKNLQGHAEIKPMSDLLNAYQHNEIKRFEKILKDHKDIILGDPFIAQFIQNLLREIRTQVLLELIRPYTRVTLPFISKQLNIPTQEVQDLLVFLILDNKIVGHIDQVQQLLLLQRSGEVAKYRYLNKWSTQLHSLHGVILNKVN